MLWELEQLEKRRAVIEQELRNLKIGSRLSGKERVARITELEREDIEAFSRVESLKSSISRDAQLTKQLDERRSRDADKALPEAERGVQETPGQPTPAQTKRLELQAKAKAWHEKSVTERSIENSKLLDNERDAGWEPVD